MPWHMGGRKGLLIPKKIIRLLFCLPATAVYPVRGLISSFLGKWSFGRPYGGRLFRLKGGMWCQL
jgi:hypothetical protein